MNEVAIAYVDGRYQCYRTTDGRDRINVGPKWLTPRQAIDYIEALGARAAGEEPVHLGGDIPHRQLGADRLPGPARVRPLAHLPRRSGTATELGWRGLMPPGPILRVGPRQHLQRA